MSARALFGAVTAMMALIGAVSCAPTASTTGYAHLNAQIQDQLKTVGLGPGDVFEVRVYGEPTLTGVYRIAEDGSIDFPLVGRVSAEGLTSREISTLLGDKLRDGYLVAPSVSVYVKEYNSRKIFVLGQVNNPGSFPFSVEMNVVEAVALAGGFAPTANHDFVVVTREVDGRETRIPVPVGKISKGLAVNLELQAGDIVYVSDTLL